ncbi:hypothetical protein AZE42_02188 [Rhizopogon vesiculosus]|uniref:Uncharacterized protein n=1 Tax=Rhizopogon vesiculosus TaxID=180088 RepID=A0A1J8QFE4_9AGAM|nr:hypothetical protein AZE42_02188 [Rhizopogon vesiculosus]
MCRRWSYKIDSVIVNYSYSPMQDLLVLLTKAPPGENHEYDISFRSLSEDKFHPDAASAVVKIPDTQENLELLNPRYTEAMIFGDYYGLFCKRVHSNGAEVDVLQVWNWKVKDWYRPIAKFSLPSLPSTSAFRYILFTGNHDHDYSPFNTPLCSSWFHGSARNQLITIRVGINVGGRPCPPYTLYAEQNRFLELESTYTMLYGKCSQDSRALPWSAWGPGHTQFFSTNPSSGDRSHCCYGLRTAQLIGETIVSGGQLQPRQLCIRDFNPHRMRHYKTGDGTKWHERLVEGDPPNTDLQSLFLESIGSLPYLEIITREKFLAKGIYMDESRVILSLANEHGLPGGVEVLYFG